MARRIYRISLYLLALLGLLNFYSPSLPAWRFARIAPWPACLAAIAVGLLFELWQKRRDPAFSPALLLKSILPFAAVLAMVLLTRLFVLAGPLAMLDADAEMPVMAARQIAQDGARPIYIFSQFYQGVAAAYPYALLFKLTGSLHLSVQLLNILFFSLGVFFFAKLTYKIAGTAFYWVAFAASFLECMLFISGDTTRGFGLVFCLMAYIILQVHDILFAGAQRFFRLGIAAGLLVFQYQQALPLVLLLLFAAAAARLRRRPLAPSGRLAAGFALGAWPHLLAEIYNGFLNSRALFLSKSEAALGNILDQKNVARHFIYHPLHIESGAPSWLFLALFLSGFLLCIWLGLKGGKRELLLPPVLYLLAVLVSALVGVAPDNFRFSAHFRLFTPLALLVAAIPPALARPLQKKWVKAALLLPLLAWNVTRFVPAWQTYRRFHGYNLQTVRMLDRNPARVIYGEYWLAKRFQAALHRGKTVLSSSSFLLPRVYRSPGQYPPGYLETAKNWPLLEKGYLAYKHNEAMVAALLTRLDFRFKTDSVGLSTLFYRFRPDPPPELFHHLSLAELWAEVGSREIPWPFASPPGEILIRRTGNRLALLLPPPQKMEISEWRLHLERDGYALEFPLIYRNGWSDILLPEGANLPLGGWRSILSWKNIALKRGTAKIEGEPSGIPLLRLDLVDRQSLFFNLRGEDLLRQRSARVDIKWKGLDAPERLFSGTGFEIKAAGAPLGDEMKIQILDDRIRKIKLSCISPLDFASPAWTKIFQQRLLVESGGRRTAKRLEPGYNEVLMEVTKGESLRIRQERQSFFAAEDGNGSIFLPRTGLILLNISCLDGNDRILGDVVPCLAPAVVVK